MTLSISNLTSGMEYNYLIQSSTIQAEHEASANEPVGAALPKAVQAKTDRRKKVKMTLGNLDIGQRIQSELKEQGRTVTWLAKQLEMERTSLYYTFKQKSIDLELLMRISVYLNHNFMQDVVDACHTNDLFN